MTYDRDYILRMVREFATFLARVLKSRDDATEGRTLADLDQAAQTFVGLGLDTLLALPGDQLGLMLSIGGGLDVNRAYAAGRLLEESSRLEPAPANAADRARKALRLLADAALTFGDYLNEEHERAVARLEERLLGQDPTPLASDPTLLGRVLELHLLHGDAGRVRGLAAQIARRGDEPDDPMRALRIALRGAYPSLLGRVQSVVEGSSRED